MSFSRASDAFIGLQSYEMQAQTGQSSDFSISQYSGTWGSDAANSVLLEPELHTKHNILFISEDVQAVKWQKTAAEAQ